MSDRREGECCRLMCSKAQITMNSSKSWLNAGCFGRWSLGEQFRSQSDRKSREGFKIAFDADFSDSGVSETSSQIIFDFERFILSR